MGSGRHLRMQMHNKLNQKRNTYLVFLLYVLSFTVTAVGAEISVLSWVKDASFRVQCAFMECCGPPYVRTSDASSILDKKLEEAVYGQHIMREVLVKQLDAHLRDPNPSKALVLSFHGWTGGGKNLVAKLIAESLFEKGIHSSFYHFYIGSLDFPNNDPDTVRKLRSEIEKGFSNCEYSVFVFDEVDKMPSGFLDVIKPYSDYHESIHGVTYRKAIFILLSNAGGKSITQLVHDKWKGVSREKLKYDDFESILQKGVFNEVGGLQKSTLVESNLVTLYVPFLPLERSHVKLCARDAFRRAGIQASADKIEKYCDELASMLVYWPPERPVYSTTGCKRVAEKVNLYKAGIIFDRVEL